jgi:hypothetical protein
MNVEIGTEATQFLFWENMNAIFVAVHKSNQVTYMKLTPWMLPLVLSIWQLTPELRAQISRPV